MSVALVDPRAAATEKSTTDRLAPIPFPPAARWAFHGTARWSEERAARLAMRWFFTPPAARVAPAERAALEQASAFTLATAHGEARGYAWGRGPAVLLVHGWGGHAGQMTALVPALLACGLRAVALDLPAHWASPGERSSLLHFAAGLESAGQIVGPLRAVIAHSFGAAAATFALARGLAAERAVFFAPPAGFESFWQRFRDGLGMSGAVWRRMHALSEEWLRVRFADLEPRVLAPHRATPLLVLHDRKDGQVLFEEGAELAAAWPGAELVATRGLGHLRILRNGDCVARAVAFAA